MRKVLFAITAAALAVGCQQDKKEPGWSKGSGAERGPGASAGAPVSGDVEARLARLEKKLDKITGFLRQAVPPELDKTQTYAVPIEPGDPVMGAKDAKVTVVEAFEYLCPYCSMVAPTMEQLVEAYPKDVRVVTKYMVIHGPPALPPALALCAATKQGKAAEMNKAIWSNVWPSGPGNAQRDKATAEELEKVATAIGLNMDQYKTDVGGAECQGWLQNSGRTLQKFGVGGTPSFFVNGKPAQAGDLDSFKRLIDAEIKKVDSSGVAGGEYYDKEILAKGKKEAVMISPFDY